MSAVLRRSCKFRKKENGKKDKNAYLKQSRSTRRTIKIPKAHIKKIKLGMHWLPAVYKKTKKTKNNKRSFKSVIS